MTVTALRPRPRVASGSPGTRAEGTLMQPSPLLDLVERLLKAAEHPDIVKVERYGPGRGPWGPDVDQKKGPAATGILVRHQWSATASSWLAQWPGEEQPVDEPSELPPPRQNRAPRLAILVKQLLDAAQPAHLKAWRLVKLPNLGRADTQAHLPFGLSVVTAGGGRELMRVTATGATEGFDFDADPFPGYVIPEGVKTCLQADAVTAGRS